MSQQTRCASAALRASLAAGLFLACQFSATAAGFLSGSANSALSTVSLTSEGPGDWEHWGDSDPERKAHVPPQLSGYILIGKGLVSTSVMDRRAVAWTDGAPVLLSASNAGGVSIAGSARGFSFTAPADSRTRTLTVHVGGNTSAARFTAHLSDASAPDYVDAVPLTSGPYDRNYQLTYAALSAGQILTISWVAASGAAGSNVTLSAAALSVGRPGAIQVTSGSLQNASPGSVFRRALQVSATDSSGLPLAGVTVTFSTPATGPSASFGTAGSTATAVTDFEGIASAPALTANNIAGDYAVFATAPGFAGPAPFALSNTIWSGALQVTADSSAAPADLTLEGPADWEYPQPAVPVFKAGVIPQLGAYTLFRHGQPSATGGDPRTLTWTDGSETAPAGAGHSGVAVSRAGDGFSFRAVAGATERRLIVHVGGYSSGAVFTARLSDSSAPVFTDTIPAADGYYDRNYALRYYAASAGQSLFMTWTLTAQSAGGFITLNATALSVVPDSGRPPDYYSAATLAGLPGWTGVPEDGTGPDARFAQPKAVTVDISGNVYTVDWDCGTVRRIDPSGDAITIAGPAGGCAFGLVNGRGTAARFSSPSGSAVDHAGNVYVADPGNCLVRKITPDGDVSALAGVPGDCRSVDGTPAETRLNGPTGLVADPAGNLYLTSWNECTVRRIAPDGSAVTIAGLAGQCTSRDGTAGAARFGNPSGISYDGKGNFYIADETGCAIRRMTVAGVVTTVAGSPERCGYADGTGTDALFNIPSWTATDTEGNIYATDYLNFVVRKITPSGVVTTIAGLAGVTGSGDGPGRLARFDHPDGIGVDRAGNVYVSDRLNGTIRKLTPQTNAY